MSIYDHEEQKDYYEYEYDNDDKLVLKNYRDQKWGGGMFTIYQYDDEGKLIKEITPGLQETYYYYQQGSLVKEVRQAKPGGNGLSTTEEFEIGYFT